mmetsp:Transcript_25045/g.38032  ORF Transcript_25045/g.38032 Transcript_25045/m.38032 type:complete len:322 (-) Transcript_25045:377-1342(-)|eukprot:CAMPEP_0178932560 /NCGR_PEP_ID=MMETSP0786-20121207/22701_1 /TAXON_ID=186022 /ORGANISM="Thalassionema frauenfeldii, Strain CCMP 1798" /LENGTH=321 /DNA_ID=CAMNT_0020609897 /DNA_START=420 /DNA_END=1385 /DNA_ORIENTATION=+
MKLICFAVFVGYCLSQEIPSDLSDSEAAVESNRRLNAKPVQFYAMGDAPYSYTEKKNLPVQLANLDPTVEFAVHLGDMQDRYVTVDELSSIFLNTTQIIISQAFQRTSTCVPEPYWNLANTLKKSKVPMLITPGDNCYYDCANWKEGFQYWSDALGQTLDSNWETKYNVRRQPVRPENFAITRNRVLFIGIHTLFARKIKDQKHWNTIENQNINWTNNQLKNFAYNGKVDAVVILTHSYTRKTLYKKFWEFLSDEAETLGLPFLYLQGDAHRFYQDTPFRAKNILRTIVDRGGIADPLLVTVDSSKKNPFIFKQRSLSGDY